MWISWIISAVVLSVSTWAVLDNDFVFVISGDSVETSHILLVIFWVILGIWLLWIVLGGNDKSEGSANNGKLMDNIKDDAVFKKRNVNLIMERTHELLEKNFGNNHYKKRDFRVIVWLYKKKIRIIHRESKREMDFNADDNTTWEFLDSSIKDYAMSVKGS